MAYSDLGTMPPLRARYLDGEALDGVVFGGAALGNRVVPCLWSQQEVREVTALWVVLGYFLGFIVGFITGAGFIIRRIFLALSEADAGTV